MICGRTANLISEEDESLYDEKKLIDYYEASSANSNQRILFSSNCVSVACRSAKKFHLVFLSCAEARKSFIWCFCHVQKHEKVLFGVSDVCRSMKKFHLVFLTCAEARKSFIWCFCRVQKHEKVPFSLSAVCRSMKKFFLAFLQCAEA